MPNAREYHLVLDDYAYEALHTALSTEIDQLEDWQYKREEALLKIKQQLIDWHAREVEHSV